MLSKLLIFFGHLEARALRNSVAYKKMCIPSKMSKTSGKATSISKKYFDKKTLLPTLELWYEKAETCKPNERDAQECEENSKKMD